ncbi:MAG: HD domain-containing phosphohydrolase [Desulfobacula sp.]|jgi:HD-GYP domain-containing protein (c-di-GMP phosphodiesterase class II)
MDSDDKENNPDTIDTDFPMDNKLGRLLKVVVNEVNTYASDQIRHIQKLSEIGMALSVEKDINRLFEMIVDEARNFCKAEAGTLYIVDKENQTLKFEILQNEVLKIRMSRAGIDSITLPDVPLFINGKPNHSNVSSYVALTGKAVSIPDIYCIKDIGNIKGLDFSGTKKYDKKTGYHTRSMLVIPMRNHEEDIIGVLQLINAKDEETGQIIPFSKQYVDTISSLASQAAVALTNAQLIQELKILFYSFIQSIATAIDEKSAYTGGHISRVVDLTMMLAEAVNTCDRHPFKQIHLNEDEMEELRIAAWMHDVGKITTPEYVVDKSTKLETIFDRLHLVETRFALIKESIRYDYLNRKFKMATEGLIDTHEFEILDQCCADEIEQLQNDFEFIRSCNQTGDLMSDENIARIKAIGSRTYLSDGKKTPRLSENEQYNLCVRKGSLTDEERKIIENHAKMTLNITSCLPFPKRLARVPEYAASHHEKIDGSGYPNGYGGEMLPLQSRILAIADIFEALTARDRPYKTPMSLSQAIKILGFMKKDKHIDPDIFDLFTDSGTHLKYAKKEMTPEQIDMAAPADNSVKR